MCNKDQDKFVIDTNLIEYHIYEILKHIGENPERTGLVDTPKRVAKMYNQLFKGYDESQKPKLTVFPNNEDGVKFNGMIIDQGYFFSTCEHHIIPFFGTFSLGYIANDKLIGASKIGRLVNFHSAKLQIAERLCKDVLDDIEMAIYPAGSILIMKARHLCKEMRGVKMVNSPFSVNDARGIFLSNKDGCKDEFLSRIKE